MGAPPSNPGPGKIPGNLSKAAPRRAVWAGAPENRPEQNFEIGAAGLKYGLFPHNQNGRWKPFELDKPKVTVYNSASRAR